MKLFDFNKKFYTQNNDIILLEKQQAIQEAIKNTLGLNEFDIPMSDEGANINYFQLKTVNHPEARLITKKIEEEILKIEYVESVDIEFFFKDTNKRINLKVQIRDTDELLDLSLNLAEIDLG